MLATFVICNVCYNNMSTAHETRRRRGSPKGSGEISSKLRIHDEALLPMTYPKPQPRKRYFFLANHSTTPGTSQYIHIAARIAPGTNTVFSPPSTARMHLAATSPFFSPCLFGSASLTFAAPPSTAPARKSPSTVEGRRCVNAISGCSIERDWKRRRHADLVDPYRARVGAGTTAAREEMRATAGAREVCWRRGICSLGSPHCQRYRFSTQSIYARM